MFSNQLDSLLRKGETTNNDKTQCMDSNGSEIVFDDEEASYPDATSWQP